uniref:MSP1 protein-like protein n=1 Tax=Ganoderma boninense TaxID=34458 RepID=A0A5K1K304_9APHY|nr:MSP1 protein-like protein [Ganoderma boninense]
MLPAWYNISEHAINSGYALFEITLTNVGPNSWWHLPVCVFMLACYLGVAYITHATQGFYTYSFLNPQKEHAKLAGYIIGIGVAECLAFLLARGLIWVRMRLSGRKSRASGPSGTNPTIEEGWEEVERPGSRVGQAV